MSDTIVTSRKKVVRREAAVAREAANTRVTLSIRPSEHYPVVGNFNSLNGRFGEQFTGTGYCASAGEGNVEIMGKLEDGRVWKYEGPRSELILDSDTQSVDLGYAVQEHDRGSPQYRRIAKIVESAEKSRARKLVSA